VELIDEVRGQRSRAASRDVEVCDKDLSSDWHEWNTCMRACEGEIVLFLDLLACEIPHPHIKINRDVNSKAGSRSCKCSI
jgi:hypothetical protein